MSILANRVELLRGNAILVRFDEVVDRAGHVALQNHFRADVGEDAGAFAGRQLVGGRQNARGRLAAAPPAAAAGPSRRTRRGRRLRRRAGHRRLIVVAGRSPAASGRCQARCCPDGYCAAHHGASQAINQKNADQEPERSWGSCRTSSILGIDVARRRRCRPTAGTRPAVPTRDHYRRAGL